MECPVCEYPTLVSHNGQGMALFTQCPRCKQHYQRSVIERVDAMQAALASLPKISRLDGDQIVWDVPCVPGSKIFIRAGAHGMSGDADVTPPNGECNVIATHGDTVSIDWCHGSHAVFSRYACFNSRAAAEFAIKKARES